MSQNNYDINKMIYFKPIPLHSRRRQKNVLIKFSQNNHDAYCVSKK